MTEPTKNSSNGTSTATTSTSEAPPKPIPAGMLKGSGGLDIFANAIGLEFKDDPNSEPDEAPWSPPPSPEAETAAAIKDGEEANDEEKDLESKEEGSEDEAEVDDDADDTEDGEKAEPDDLTKLRGDIKAKTKDGKEINLPDDLTISWKVDGEVKEINLKEHLNVVAGELTVNQRLGKVASFKEQLDKERGAFQTKQKEETEKYQTLVKFCQEGKVDSAMCYMAELAGTSPVQMYRSMLTASVKAADGFADKTPEQIENAFMKMELDWQKDKTTKEAQKREAEARAEEFNRRVSAEIQDEDLTYEDFDAAVAHLSQNEPAWKDWSPEQRKDEAIERALLGKHTSLIGQALDKKNPKLRKNEKLVELLLKHTDPHKWSVDQIIQLIDEVLGAETKKLATTLSRKVISSEMQNSQKKDGKNEKKKTARSSSEMAAIFGLARTH